MSARPERRSAAEHLSDSRLVLNGQVADHGDGADPREAAVARASARRGEMRNRSQDDVVGVLVLRLLDRIGGRLLNRWPSEGVERLRLVRPC
eukprot:1622326-Pyramimonas_sp.AAC.2